MVGQDAKLAGLTNSDRPASSSSTPAGKALHGLAKRSLLSLGGSAFSAVLSFFLIVIVTRGVDQTSAGVLFSTTSVFLILEGLCALGTTTGLVYFIARLRAKNQFDAVPAVLRTALVPVVVISVLTAVALVLLAPQLAQYIASESDELAVVLLRVMALLLPVAVAHDVLLAASQSYHTMLPTVTLERIGRPLLQVVGVTVAILVGVPETLTAGWFAAYLVTASLAIWWVRRLLTADTQAISVPADPIRPRAFWGYAGPRGVAAAAQLSMQRLDVVLVAFYLGAAPAAVYTAATRFVVLGQLGSQAVAQAVQPMFSHLLATDDLEGMHKVYRVSTAWIIVVTWPIHLTVAVLAPVLLMAFGTGYEGGRSTMLILAFAMLIATGCGMVTMLLLMSGNTAANLINVLVALAINVSLNILLIPRWGIEGAATAWAASLVVANLLPLAQIRHQFGVTPFGREVTIAILIVLASFSAPGLAALLGANGWILVALTAVGLLLHVVGMVLARRPLHFDELLSSLNRRLRPKKDA